MECVQITVLANAKTEDTLCPREAHPLVGSQTSARKTGVHPIVRGIVRGVVADMEMLYSDLPRRKDSLSSCRDGGELKASSCRFLQSPLPLSNYGHALLGQFLPSD